MLLLRLGGRQRVAIERARRSGHRFDEAAADDGQVAVLEYADDLGAKSETAARITCCRFLHDATLAMRAFALIARPKIDSARSVSEADRFSHADQVNVMTGRISIEPILALGIRAAILVAPSRSLASTR